MPRTSVERRLLQRRESKGVLVPLIEDFLEEPCDVEDEADFDFLTGLMAARAVQREKGIFSPSMLSSCVRQSYLAKTGHEKRRVRNPRANGFFIDGNFRHYRWQFIMWKMHRAKIIKLLGVEVRVYNAAGDFAGTIDAVIEIDGTVYVVDFKGMNVRAFQSFQMSGTPLGYKIQIAGYGMILAIQGEVNCMVMGKHAVTKIEKCLLVAENKSGPSDRGSPLGIQEELIPVRSMKGKVKQRINLLRRYVENEEVPAPECQTTKTVKFVECPFSYYCRSEIRQIENDLKRSRTFKPIEIRKPKGKRA